MISLAILSGVLFVSALPAQTNIYVKVTAAGSGNGSSWDDAATLSEALSSIASYGNTIYVAAGDYSGPFEMKEGVTVLGGYPADAAGTDLTGRRLPGSGENLTTLRGNSSNRVLTQSKAFDDETLWEGFVLTGGNSDNTQWGGGGAYLLLNGVLRNCIIKENNAVTRGGGVYAGASSRVEGCLVTGNTASDGAGIYNWGGTVLNCTVVDNILAGDTPLPISPQIGYYYYADGSWSAMLDDQKVLVGIVCKINPSNPYNGLIMYIEEDTDTPRKNWEDSKSWAKGITAGGLTGWRLPDIRELQDIYGKMDDLNSVLQTVPGGTELGVQRYWSGSEAMNNKAWMMNFEYESLHDFSTVVNLHRVRAVRVF